MEIKNAPVPAQVTEMDKVDVSRRRFFQLAGGIAGAGLLLSACRRRSEPTDTALGSGDVALLNLFYIIQQIEAAFYTQAVATPFYSLTVSESQLLTDVRDQEIAHMEYMKALLGKNAVSPVSVNFTNVTFADRGSVLKHASIIEDLAVSCINGSAHLYSNTDYVFTLSKIVSVEARHAGYFRTLASHNSSADNTIVDTFGMDVAATPSAVLASAGTYLYTRFDSSKLPNQ